MSVREFCYNLLRTDAFLAEQGIDTDRLYPNFAPDSPAKSGGRFVVLRWGPEGPRVGRDTTVRPWDLEVWVYDMEPDFGSIDRIMKRVKTLLRGSEGASHGNGYINGIIDNGGSADLPATEYGREAVAKNWSFTIHASEEGT